MTLRILAASVLALGFLAPVGAMAADTSYNCSEEQRNKKDYTDCDANIGNSNVTYGFAAQDIEVRKPGTVGDYLDETREESNQRSGSNRTTD
jgi:hypothetical protein